MYFDPDIFHRRSIRLKHYDYSQVGVYFVTICSFNKEHIFGEIIDGHMEMNQFGKIVEDEWHKTGILRKNVELDIFVVMPNHFHGIVMIQDVEWMWDWDCRGKARLAPTEGSTQKYMGQFGRPISGSLPTIIGSFKSAVTKCINETRKTPRWPVWQRNYYERFIRNERELNQVRQYILSNPLQWDFDEENM